MAAYTYEIVTIGPKKSIKVFENDTAIWTGPPSFSAAVDVLIQEAKTSLFDSYPGVEGMTLRQQAVPVPDVQEPIVEEKEPEPLVAEEPAPITTKDPPKATYKTEDYVRTSPPVKKQDDGRTRNDRIWNIFKTTITLDELSINKDNADSSQEKNLEDNISVSYPFVKINDYVFGSGEIDFLTIDCRNFLPTISLTTVTANDIFLSKNFPKDGDIISIMIRNKTDLLNPIRNDYVITGTAQQMKSTLENEISTITFFGELFVPGLKGYNGSEAFKGTSMDALKTLTQHLELGFNSNEEQTDDLQIWYKHGTPIETIQDITSKAWKDENSFFDSWIDVYYNLNFVNVQKELLADESKIDMAALLNNIDQEFDYGIENKETSQTAKVFSNFIGLRSSSSYINKWKPNNRSSAITFEYGTTASLSFFEHQDKLYIDDAQKYWKFEVTPKYDPEKLDTHILLRGRSKYDPNINTDQMARANYSYANLYTKVPWLGIQYTISNPEDENTQWTGNHHKNYMRAQLHNAINLAELEKLNVEISVQGTNTNYIKGEKIPVVIIKTDSVEVKMAYPDSDQSEEIDFFYSGWYMIKGFKLEWGKNEENILSNFSQAFVLTRREWPPPEKVKGATYQ